MLGLGTSVTNIDSGQIYKELSELSNYDDLDIHFDFSILAGAHGSTVESAQNLGQTEATNSIESSEGTPTLDKTSLSKTCVDFPNSGDTDQILSMAADYSTTGKAMTFFIVFQWDVTSVQMLVTNGVSEAADYIQLATGGRMKFAMAGGTASNVITSNTNSSTVDYTPAIDTPVVMLIRREAGGDSYFYHDNNIFTALLSDTGDANFTLGALGGTTSGSLDDFNGKIGEVGLYDADIGVANVAILLESLCTKWGINRRE